MAGVHFLLALWTGIAVTIGIYELAYALGAALIEVHDQGTT